MYPMNSEKATRGVRNGSWNTLTSALLSNNTITSSFSPSETLFQNESNWRTSLRGNNKQTDNEPSVFDPSDRVKILVLGDSNVGKTSFLHLLCHQTVLARPSRTVGCSVDVMIHRYPSTSSQTSGTPFFVEFYDLAGYTKHKSSHDSLYAAADGAILVFDMTNKKSCDNLTHKLAMLDHSSHIGATRSSTILGTLDSSGEPALERSSSQTFGNISESSDIPLMLVGNKSDLASGAVAMTWASSAVAHLHLSNEQQKHLCTIQVNSKSESSVNEQYLAIYKFLDSVIKRKLSV